MKNTHIKNKVSEKHKEQRNKLGRQKLQSQWQKKMTLAKFAIKTAARWTVCRLESNYGSDRGW